MLNETATEGDLAEQIREVLRASHREFRGELREALREVMPRRSGGSRLDQERARIDGDLRDAKLAERHASEDVAEAARAVERARASFLRTCETNRYGPDIVPLEVKLRQAEAGLGRAQRELAACRRVRERAEGEHLNYARFDRA